MNSFVFMIPSVRFDYIIWVAIYKYQTPPKGGKGGCTFIAWISIFEPPAHPAWIEYSPPKNGRHDSPRDRPMRKQKTNGYVLNVFEKSWGSKN